MAQRFKTPITVEGAAAASSQAVAAKVDGDTQNRVQIDAGGKITWGDGSSAGDANLYRSAANAIKTDDTLEAASGLITLTTSGAPTASLSDGALAIDTTNNEFYIRSGGAWIKQGGGGATQSDTAPSNPVAGDLWYETDTGAMYVYYDSAWIEVGTAGVIAMSTTSTPPSSPGNGDLWFDIDTAKTYVYYDDGTSTQWVEVGAASAAASGADGSVQFASGGTFSSDASNFYWDDTNNRLGIGTTSPAEELHILKDQNGDLTQVLIENLDQRVRIGSYYEAGVAQYGKIQSEQDAGGNVALVLNPEGGNVGIGTTSPSAQLTVQAGSTGVDDGTVEFHKWLGTASSPTESEDWPTPVLALRSYDNFNTMNMLSFGYPQDAVYQTGGNVWSFRLSGTSGATASSSSTNLQVVGPGTLDINSAVDISGAIATLGSTMLGVRQVLASHKTGLSLTTTTEIDTGLSVTITPKSTSSKILIFWAHAFYLGGNCVFNSRLKRGTTQLQLNYAGDWGAAGNGTVNNYYLDSPNTTSAVTYKTTMQSNNATTVYVSNSSSSSYLLVVEIL